MSWLDLLNFMRIFRQRSATLRSANPGLKLNRRRRLQQLRNSILRMVLRNPGLRNPGQEQSICQSCPVDSCDISLCGL